MGSAFVSLIHPIKFSVNLSPNYLSSCWSLPIPTISFRINCPFLPFSCVYYLRFFYKELNLIDFALKWISTGKAVLDSFLLFINFPIMSWCPSILQRWPVRWFVSIIMNLRLFIYWCFCPLRSDFQCSTCFGLAPLWSMVSHGDGEVGAPRLQKAL